MLENSHKLPEADDKVFYSHKKMVTRVLNSLISALSLLNQNFTDNDNQFVAQLNL